MTYTTTCEQCGAKWEWEYSNHDTVSSPDGHGERSETSIRFIDGKPCQCDREAKEATTRAENLQLQRQHDELHEEQIKIYKINEKYVNTWPDADPRTIVGVKRGYDTPRPLTVAMMCEYGHVSRINPRTGEIHFFFKRDNGYSVQSIRSPMTTPFPNTWKQYDAQYKQSS